MAPSIPTHRPIVTATRVAVSIAVAACASSLYLAFGSAWAATGMPDERTSSSAVCPVGTDHAVAPVGAQASVRGERPSNP